MEKKGTTQDTLKVEPMSKNDIDIVAEYFYRTFGPEGLGEPWTRETSREHLKEEFNPNYSFVAKKKGEVVGAIIASPDKEEKGTELYIDFFIVRKDKRGKGIGRKLWDEVINKAKQKELVGVRLLAHSKFPFFALYQKKGLKETGWKEMVRFFKD